MAKYNRSSAISCCAFGSLGRQHATGGDETVFTSSNVVAFRNTYGELVVIFGNDGDKMLPVALQSGNSTTKLEVPAKSMNSFVFLGW